MKNNILSALLLTSLFSANASNNGTPEFREEPCENQFMTECPHNFQQSPQESIMYVPTFFMAPVMTTTQTVELVNNLQFSLNYLQAINLHNYNQAMSFQQMALALQNQIQQKDQELVDAKEQLSHMQEQATLSTELSQKQKDIDERERKIAEREQKLEKEKSTLAKQQKTIAKQNKTITTQQQTIAQQNKTIETQKQTIMEQAAVITDREKTIKTLKDDIDSLTKTNSLLLKLISETPPPFIPTEDDTSKTKGETVNDDTTSTTQNDNKSETEESTKSDSKVKSTKQTASETVTEEIDDINKLYRILIAAQYKNGSFHITTLNGKDFSFKESEEMEKHFRALRMYYNESSQSINKICIQNKIKMYVCLLFKKVEFPEDVILSLNKFTNAFHDYYNFKYNHLEDLNKKKDRSIKGKQRRNAKTKNSSQKKQTKDTLMEKINTLSAAKNELFPKIEKLFNRQHTTE